MHELKEGWTFFFGNINKYIYSYNYKMKEIQRNNKIILDMRWHIIQYYPLPSTYSHLHWASQRDGIYVNILYLL